MKKIILSFLLIFLLSASYAQELKGYRIGSSFSGDFKINEVGTRYSEINTTLGGVNGVLSFGLTKHKIIASVIFESNESVSQTAFNHIKEGIEDKHNIGFFEIDKNSYIYDSQNIVYIIQRLDDNGISVVIMDKELYEEITKEDEGLKDDDF